MSSAKFQLTHVGTQPNDETLRPGELGASLMERAQRGRLLNGQLQHETTHLAAAVATSNLRHEQALSDLHQQKLALYERERSTRQNIELRAGFDLPQFTAGIESIRDLLDPAAQLGAIVALRTSYAKYRTVSELTQLMDEQFASLEPVIAANQESRLHERITANRYALTPEEAAAKFPGYRITPTVIPNGPTANGGRNVRLIYLAEDEVDPHLEAEAFQLLHTASAWADPAKLEALGRDPAVAAVLRVPGSKFARAYIEAIAAAHNPAPASGPSASTALGTIAPVTPTDAPSGDLADVSAFTPAGGRASDLSEIAPHETTLNSPIGPSPNSSNVEATDSAVVPNTIKEAAPGHRAPSSGQFGLPSGTTMRFDAEGMLVPDIDWSQQGGRIADNASGVAVFIRQGTSIVVGFIPIAGSVQSAVELLSGKDYISGEDANRLLAGVGLVVGVIPGGTGLLKAGRKIFARTVKNADEAVELATVVAKKGDGVIYLRTHPTTHIDYVGQAKNWSRYLARRGEHDRAKHIHHLYGALLRGQAGASLDVLEEAAIRAYGGTASGVLANLRHEMSEERFLTTVTQLLRDYQLKILMEMGVRNGAVEAIETITSP